ncbi:MAG: hypothetical protein GEV07_24135 [Streptosporangiales bacterium]|nr:hypothetical protein [Streptosporangiales bacterium]
MTSSETAVRAPVRRRPALRWTVVACAGAYALPLAVAALVSRPQLFGLSDVTGFLHLAAFPAVRGIAWSVVAVVLAGVVLVARRRYLVWLLVVAALAGGFDLATTALRGVGGQLPPPSPGDISVVTVNTLNEMVSPEEVGKLVVEEHAVALAMPETSRTFADEVAAYLAERDVRMQVFGGVPRELAWPSVTSLLVSTTLGRYETVARAKPTLDAVAAAPVRGDGPTFAAVHTPPPFVPVSAPRAWEGIWRDGASRAAALAGNGART